MLAMIAKNFEKVNSGEIKPEEAKKLQNVFKPILNKISRGRNKPEEQIRSCH